MTTRTITNSRLIEGEKLDNLPADTNAELALKVDKVAGKELSTNDYTNTDKAKVDATSGTNTGDQDLSGLAEKTNVLELDNTTAFTPDADYEPATKKYVDDNASTGAVDSVNTQTGDVVLDADDISDITTTNKYTTQAEIDKLAGIEALAEVNTLNDVVAGTNVTIDKTDPLNPIVSSTSAGGQVDSVVGGTNITVDATDPINPIVNSDITDATIPTSDITTNNVSTSKHGFTPKLSGNSTQFLDGQGNYSTPAGIVNSYTTTSFTSQTSIVVNHGFGAIALVQILDSGNNEVIPENIEHTSINSFTVTFNQAETGTIIASVGSPQAANLTTVPGNYTVQTGDNIIKCTGLGSTITLLTAVGIAGIEFKIDNDTLGDIFIDTTGSETIQGESIQTLPSQSSVTVYSDGTNWRVN